MITDLQRRVWKPIRCWLHTCQFVAIKGEWEKETVTLPSGTKVKRKRILRLYECPECGMIYDDSSTWDYYPAEDVDTSLVNW